MACSSGVRGLSSGMVWLVRPLAAVSGVALSGLDQRGRSDVALRARRLGSC